MHPSFCNVFHVGVAMGRKRKSRRASSKIKQVHRKTFEEQVEKVLRGETSFIKAGMCCGVSKETFAIRFKQYTQPEEYGSLPEDFFYGRGLKKQEEKKEDVKKEEVKEEQAEENKKIVLPDLSGFL